jgi:putative nucleotidyltransferase with HDIG domain
MNAIEHRIRQGLRAVRPQMPVGGDRLIAEILTSNRQARFQRLPAFDQAHLVRATQALLAMGETDPELVAATLLHDVGKTNEHGSVRLIHRVSRVLVRKISPGAFKWLSRHPEGGWRNGFVLATHHPELGAAIAAELGCSERICRLIRNHENPEAAGDPAIASLMAADRCG